MILNIYYCYLHCLRNKIFNIEIYSTGLSYRSIVYFFIRPCVRSHPKSKTFSFDFNVNQVFFVLKRINFDYSSWGVVLFLLLAFDSFWYFLWSSCKGKIPEIFEILLYIISMNLDEP